jgi:hypothetical protein
MKPLPRGRGTIKQKRGALVRNGVVGLSPRTRAIFCILVVSIFLIAFAVDLYDDNILNSNPDDDYMNMDVVTSFMVIVYFCASEITLLPVAHYIPILPSLLIGFLMLRAPPAGKSLINVKIKARGMRQLPYSPCFFIAN